MACKFLIADKDKAVSLQCFPEVLNAFRQRYAVRRVYFLRLCRWLLRFFLFGFAIRAFFRAGVRSGKRYNVAPFSFPRARELPASYGVVDIITNSFALICCYCAQDKIIKYHSFKVLPYSFFFKVHNKCLHEFAGQCAPPSLAMLWFTDTDTLEKAFFPGLLSCPYSLKVSLNDPL